VADRLSVFSNPEMIRLICEHFIPVAQNDWYARRREDAVGRYFVGIANQGPRKGEGGSTRQGIYAFTASGKLLAFNNNRALDRRIAMLEEALEEWKKLPANERDPGTVKVPDLKPKDLDPRFTRVPPPGGLIVNIYTRALDHADGQLATCSADDDGSLLGLLSARDHLWLREEEWKGMLANASAAEGKPVPLPEAIAYRICRYHLIDNTRGEPPLWNREEVREQNLTIRQSGNTPEGTRFEIAGKVVLATDANPVKAKRGYEAEIQGTLVATTDLSRITRFDLLALGDHWGEGAYTGGAREGRKPLGVAFELATGKSIGDEVPPQGISWEQGYYKADRD
jgi:hypothetical protein